MTNSPLSIAPLVERVKTVITDPSGCWATVSADGRDAKTLFKEYAVPMAVIGGLAGVIGSFVSGLASLVGVGIILLQFLSAVIMTCAAGFVAAFIATKIASLLGGDLTLDKAYSWYLHASMVSFVGGLAVVIPALGGLVGFVAAIAMIYWAWQGIPSMINVPVEKRVLFLIGTIVVNFVALVLLSLVFGSFLIGSGAVPISNTLPQ
jgi:hypothetical protein